MRGSTVRWALVAALAAAAVVSPVSASRPRSLLEQLATTPLAATERVRTIAEAVRTDRASDALAALLAAQGTPARAHRVTATDPMLPAPVARLVAAARTAETLRARAISRLTSEQRAAALALLRTVTVERPGHPGGDAALLETRASTLVAEAATIAAAVDERALRDAALTILTEIDRQTPVLAALPSTPLAPSACGAGGDMLLETEDCRVMVGGDGPNTYPAGVDPDVLIDVGGDDTYTNGAARASGVVRVLVDVAGDDTYAEAATSATPGGPVTHAAGQGVGVLGVGVLADLGGDDGYSLMATAAAPEPGPVASAAQSSGQGAAIAGAGVLVDAGGGADTFTATASSTGGPAVSIAQGQATIGLGTLISLGDGDEDAYSSEATSTLHQVERTNGYERFSIGEAGSVAQGATDLAGVALLADRAGSDSYRSSALGAAGRSIAQGGSVGGAALLVDIEGDDAMTSQATGDASLSLITTDPTVCWTATVTVNTSATSSIGQGGAFGGVAGLVDIAGNDQRALLASSRAEAIAEARSDHVCDGFGGNTARATARTGNADSTGQGAALLGIGVLADVAGTDSSRLEVSSAAVARAIAISPGADVEQTTATAGSALAQGQGFSAVGLSLDADLGGNDTRSATARTEVSRTTSAGTTATSAPGDVRVHGWVNGGRSYLVDVGGTDGYATDPAGVSAAGNDRCWSNTPDGRGIDWVVGPPVPVGCL